MEGFFFFVAKEMATHVWLKSYGSKAQKNTKSLLWKFKVKESDHGFNM
jgi:hypothetical protein